MVHIYWKHKLNKINKMKKKLINNINYVTRLMLILISTITLITSCKDPNVGDQSDFAVRGCTNPAAANYNASATLEDGSCIVVSSTQNSVFVKFTATWCGPCGSYGAPTFENKMNTHKGKILAISLQYNDALSTADNEGLVSGFLSHMPPPGGSLSTPSFGVNNQYFAQTLGAADAEVNSKYATDPNIGLGIKYTIGAGKNHGKLNINAIGKFFKQVNGEYKISILAISKKLVAPQKVDDTYTDSFEHKQVLLGSITTGGLYGEPFHTGSAQPGTLAKWSKAVAIKPSWDLTNLELGVIVWRKNGNAWVFENCTVSK